MFNVAPTDFQQRVLRYRGRCNILNAGGRGSGKSFCLILDLLDHCRRLGPTARPLVLRESWAGLQELQEKVMSLAVIAFGPGVRRNKADGTITLPTGGVISFTNIGDGDSYAKLQGRSFTGLYADEVGNYPPQAFRFLNLVRSNLRVAPGQHTDIQWTANPHGRSHTVLYKRLITRSPPWVPFLDDAGDTGVWTTSTLDDNPHIERESYRRQLIASVGSDRNLAEAWISGSWSVLGGVMFDAFDPTVHIITPPPSYVPLRRTLGGDWGSAAPAVCLLLGELKDWHNNMRPGSIIVLGETDTADPNDLSVGTGAPPQMFAEQIKEMAGKCRTGHMDDARGLQSETVIGLLREAGLHFQKPFKKDRVGQWALIRQLLQNAVTGDGPGLYFANCPNLIDTLPEAPRGPNRPEDIDPRWSRDHWLDALAYGITGLRGGKITTGRVEGLY